MEWKNYESRFKLKASINGIDERKVDQYLLYAEELYKNQLPLIFNQNHLSLLVGYKEEYLERAISNTQFFYRYFSVPKKNGGLRDIAEPLPSLKEIQRWILDNILYKCKCSKFSKAYIPNNSIKTNAKFHRKQKSVLTLDIRNYFPSITIEKVKEFFGKIGYNQKVSSILSSLCCLDGYLPQGSPTSPMLSNLITKDMDEEIASFISSLNIRYSRYADDLTFSGDFKPGFIIKNVKKILESNGFQIHEEKIRVQGQHERQIVTGIVVNQDLKVAKYKRKEIRQIIYFIKKYGFEDHVKKIQIKKLNYLDHLIGLVNYAIFINSKELEMKKYLTYLYLIKNQLKQIDKIE